MMIANRIRAIVHLIIMHRDNRRESLGVRGGSDTAQHRDPPTPFRSSIVGPRPQKSPRVGDHPDPAPLSSPKTVVLFFQFFLELLERLFLLGARKCPLYALGFGTFVLFGRKISMKGCPDG